MDLIAMGPTEIAKDFGPNYFRDAAAKGITVTQLLENLDDSTRYARDSEERKLDAFERLSQEMGFVQSPLDARGIRASTYEDVTKTEEGRAWFAEFSNRVWRQASRWVPETGMTRALFQSYDYIQGSAQNPWADDLALRAPRLEVEIPLATIISGVRQISGDAYRSVYITDSLSNDAYRMKRVNEGADIPATSLVTGEHYLRIHKFGRAIRYTYEQLRRQTIDRIAFLLARMALMAESDKVGLALDVLINGDGNSNTAATVYALTTLDGVAVAGTLTLKGWQAFKRRFSPYVPRVILAQEASIGQLEHLPLSVGNSLPMIMAPANAFGTISPLNPTAANLRYGIVAGAPALKLTVFDPAWGVEMVSEIGSTISELERYVNNQTYMLTMTEANGFGTIDPLAVRILNINA